MNEDSKIINPGKNLFLLDGPIGRLQLVKTYAIIIGFCLLISIVNTIIILLFGLTKYTKIASITLFSLCIIPTFYILFIAYIKRLYDIIGAKDKAIFYTIIIFAIRFTLPLIPFLHYTSIIFAIVVNAILLFKQGKYIRPKQKEKTNEEN